VCRNFVCEPKQGRKAVPPTPEDLENLRQAELRMYAARDAQFAFIERQDRQYTQEEVAENRRLIDNTKLAMDEFWEAFNRCQRR
jgi:hypothetical protein